MIPLAPVQQRLWFLSRAEPGPVYNVPLRLRLTGELDREALEEALADVAERHAPLRTLMPEQDGRPYQRILDPVAGAPRLEALSGAQAEAVCRTVFDLTAEPPLRTWLVGLGPDEHLLVLLLHHIAVDGWSVGPLLRDLGAAYAARCVGSKPGWDPLPVQYADYAEWQWDVLGRAEDPDSELSRQLLFWKQTLDAVPHRLRLPADHAFPEEPTRRAGIVSVPGGPALRRRLAGLAQASGTSPFMVVQAAIAALLSAIGAGPDLPLGVPIAGRTEEALADLVGFFVNTLVVRVDTSGDPAFRELLGRVKSATLAAYAHQEVPFERVVEQVNPVRTHGLSPLVQVLLGPSGQAPGGLDFGPLAARLESGFTGNAKFDLIFDFHEVPGAQGAPADIEFLLEYAEDLYEPDTAYALVSRLVRLLDGVLADPDRPLSRVDLLSPAERARLLAQAGGPGKVRPAGTPAQLFERQAAASPTATAVASEAGSLTYTQLNAAANRLARALAARGAGPGQVVAVRLARSAELVTALLATAKTGAAVVLVDPGEPEQRARAVLRDAAPVLTVTTHALAPAAAQGPVLELDSDELAAELAQYSEANAADQDGAAAADARSPACVHYASDPAGNPRGLIVPHEAIHDLAWAWAERLGAGAGGRTLPLALPGQDAVPAELFGTFAAGLTLEASPATGTGPGQSGAPVGNARLYVLGPGLDLAPPGAVGELYAQVPAIGYLGRPALTADRFVACPFGEPGTRMARTGDLVRWRADGRLEFLGRTDRQVVLQGLRVEPGEIEAALIRDDAVDRAVVVVREDLDGDPRLVAYVVPKNPDEEINVRSLLRSVEEWLPGHMVPAVVIPLTALPLRPDGRVDDRALPAPDYAAVARQTPRTDLEASLCELFEELLGLPNVGVTEGFFELGGHSLLITQLAGRVRGRWGVRLPLATIIQHSNPAALAAYVAERLPDPQAAPARPQPHPAEKSPADD